MHKIYNLTEYCNLSPWKMLDPRNDNLYPAIVKDEANHNDEAIFIIHNNLIIGRLSRLSSGKFWTLGSDKVITAKDITEAIDIVKSIDKSFEGFKLVSKELISKKLPDHIEIKQGSKDEYEYIYDTGHIAKMESSQHATLRRYVKKFNNLYGDNLSIDIYENDSDRVLNDELLDLYHSWLEHAGLSEGDLSQESQSFKNYLNSRIPNSYHRPFKIVARYKDKIVGISINDVVSDHHAINLYMFSNLNLTGISHFMLHATNTMLNDIGVKVFNYQEDMGSKGLRNFKKLLRPIDVYELVDVISVLK